jgi:hypothetical protein
MIDESYDDLFDRIRGNLGEHFIIWDSEEAELEEDEDGTDFQ